MPRHQIIDVCPYCGIKYEDFETYGLRQLGGKKAHMVKMDEWGKHIYNCRDEQEFELIKELANVYY